VIINIIHREHWTLTWDILVQHFDTTSITIGGTHWDPFIDGNINRELPFNWKSLPIDNYDRATNLDQHVVTKKKDEHLLQ